MNDFVGRKVLLVRVGTDSSYGGGGWNAPVNPFTYEFAYVPIPEDHKQILSEYRKSYTPFVNVCKSYNVEFPEELLNKPAHLDPDFKFLTYGDRNRKGIQIKNLLENDILAFYAGLRMPESHQNKLLYALIGLYVVSKVIPASEVQKEDWDKNAHTRRMFDEKDWIVIAKEDVSGRLDRCIPIGKWRKHAYRVRCDLLNIWGGLTSNDGYLQRSAVLPSVKKPDEFYKWFKEQNVPLQRKNN